MTKPKFIANVIWATIPAIVIYFILASSPFWAGALWTFSLVLYAKSK